MKSTYSQHEFYFFNQAKSKQRKKQIIFFYYYFLNCIGNDHIRNMCDFNDVVIQTDSVRYIQVKSIIVFDKPKMFFFEAAKNPQHMSKLKKKGIDFFRLKNGFHFTRK